MSTIVTFAGNLAEAPEAHHTRENNKPFVTCRVLVNRRFQNDQGEWVSDEPTACNVKIFGSAATRVHDSCGSGDPIFVHSLERTESWPDKETGEKRTKDVVVVDNRFGEVGIPLKYVPARIDRAPHAAQAS
ncbi:MULTISPECIES: single-stranded DNA-binding protein [Nocardioides]|uniref:Single-stranded DNA-binding protein n=1 Tax=Nocardioides vastitatis TaxID=2568655 RepID=A0ABW0ZMT8_9ACTN|nr:single-stranded DNA-binding protein [Nocardioides sp.]THJ06250.1 single-stranded DNA-binding protein [Nocardioides sp.]